MSMGSGLWRCRLMVASDTSPDALLRILGAVAVQSIALAAVQHQASGAGATSRLEVLVSSPERAVLLAARLAQTPGVRGVELLEGRPSTEAELATLSTAASLDLDRLGRPLGTAGGLARRA
jgi:acetolactate synthase regulatory subunit